MVGGGFLQILVNEPFLAWGCEPAMAAASETASATDTGELFGGRDLDLDFLQLGDDNVGIAAKPEVSSQFFWTGFSGRFGFFEGCGLMFQNPGPETNSFALGNKRLETYFSAWFQLHGRLQHGQHLSSDHAGTFR